MEKPTREPDLTLTDSRVRFIIGSSALSNRGPQVFKGKMNHAIKTMRDDFLLDRYRVILVAFERRRRIKVIKHPIMGRPHYLKSLNVKFFQTLKNGGGIRRPKLVIGKLWNSK